MGAIRGAATLGFARALLAGASTPAAAQTAKAAPTKLAMTVGKTAPAPRAFYSFCEQNPQDCAPQGDVASFKITPERLDELDAVNREVNGAIRQITDQDHFGVSDVWGFPDDGAGDCEDFALLKRRKLMDLGWPSSRLLMSAVLDNHGEGHAVLVAVTDKGDLVLDNKRDDIRSWTATGYFFLTRQSQLTPEKWVFTAPPNQILVALRRANAALGSRNASLSPRQR